MLCTSRLIAFGHRLKLSRFQPKIYLQSSIAYFIQHFDFLYTEYSPVFRIHFFMNFKPSGVFDRNISTYNPGSEIKFRCLFTFLKTVYMRSTFKDMSFYLLFRDIMFWYCASCLYVSHQLPWQFHYRWTSIFLHRLLNR